MLWQIESYDLGRTYVWLLLDGLRVELDVYDGGGFVPGNAIWRIAGRIARIAQAARC